jgi:hypothetical protein
MAFRDTRIEHLNLQKEGKLNRGDKEIKKGKTIHAIGGGARFQRNVTPPSSGW